MRLASLLLVASCMVACSGDDVAPAPDVVPLAPPRDFWSGSRLEARYDVVDQAVAVFTTWHDAQLDVDCAFEDDSGPHVGPGTASYCLPSVAHHRAGTGPYLDVLCRTPAAFAPSTGAATYAVVEPLDACATAPEVHLAKPAQMRTAYVLDESGACGPSQNASLQALGAIVPLATFVRGIEQVETRTSRIGARVLAGDDGSVRVVGGWDRARNEAVRDGLGDDGVRRWLPARTAFVGASEPLFSDAKCAKMIAAKIARTATCPLSATVVLDGSCGSGHYFGLGPTPSAVFHRDDSNTCAVTPARSLRAYGLGAPIAASAYEAVATTDVGTPLAKRRAIGTAGDAPVAWSSVIDVQTGEACDVVVAADGVLRCLPSVIESIAFFADAACTEPAIASPVTGCETGGDPKLVRDMADGMPHVYDVVRPIDVIYTQTAKGCAKAMPSVTSKMFAVKEADPSRFPTATRGGD